MTAFTNFPAITYDFTSKTDAIPVVETIQDLTTKISLIISDADMENLCFRYTIKNGELPQTISQNTYGTFDYDWTILYINTIANLNAEWPLTDLELIAYATTKYGFNNLYNIHHYEKLPEGLVMDSDFITNMYGAQYVNPLTNVDYETELNEQKRFIYVIKKENISNFVTQFNALLLA
jgi:hypothetical protein